MIVKWWRTYIAWCDRMGLTAEAQRCCAPKLTDPSLMPVTHQKDRAACAKPLVGEHANTDKKTFNDSCSS